MPLTTDSEGSPIIVIGDTDADTEILALQTYIQFIEWFNPTAAGHLLALQDGTGRNLVELICATANVSEWAPLWMPVDGIRCNDMDSGTLYIYIR